MSKNISFITETEVEQKKRHRQEEWEKTRKPDEPEEAPEEKYDPRTLYQRLQEQKMKKQEEFDEGRKLKNLIKTLDNDEIEFLQAIDNTRAEYENQKYQEELQALDEYKRGVTDLTVEEQEKRLLEYKRELFQAHKKKTAPDSANGQKRKANSQAELLSKIIKRKSTVPPSEVATKGAINLTAAESQSTSSKAADVPISSNSSSKSALPANMPTIQCIGILPGIGCYDDNSDSCDSDRESDEDEVQDFQVFADPDAHEH